MLIEKTWDLPEQFLSALDASKIYVASDSEP